MFGFCFQFRTHGSQGGLYLLQDTHYNTAGNTLAAEMIRDFLYEQQLIPGLAMTQGER